MAKTKVTDWSATASDNEDIGGTGILGTNQRSNFDNALREMMAQWAKVFAGTDAVYDTFTYGDPGDLTKRFRFDGGSITAGQTRIYSGPDFNGTLALLEGAQTFTGSKTFSTTAEGTIATFTSTHAGANPGPVVGTFRDSASPAANDFIGALEFNGRDSAANTQNYAILRGQVIDPTSTSEDGRLSFLTVIAGTLANRFHVGAGLYSDGVTGGDKGAGTINATTFYQAGNAIGIAASTALATTSGTTKDFTSIPAGVKRITLMLSGVSTNGTNLPLIQIGDSGGIEAAGYLGAVGNAATPSATQAVNHDTGFALMPATAAADVLHGIATLTLITGTTWMFGWSGGISNNTYAYFGGGTKALSATLDRVRLTTVGGADAFDAGSVNIFYEF